MKRIHNAARGAAGVPKMSDHAMIRLLERSGLDVQAIRAGIEQALGRSHAAALAMGNVDHLITVDGMSFVVRDGVVTTVMEAGHPMHQHARLSRNRQP